MATRASRRQVFMVRAPFSQEEENEGGDGVSSDFTFAVLKSHRATLLYIQVLITCSS